ncbi:MAG: glycosyltransferase, partial [Bacteriovoracia bacterium]
MKVTVTLELRFDVLPDGTVWTLSNFHRSFWNRYLDVFQKVEIVARANYVEAVNERARRVDDGEQVIFKPLPYYLGPVGYLKKWTEIRRHLKEIEKDSDAVILRVGSPIADILQPLLVSREHPYAVEVVGDPYDTFAPGSVKSILRPFYRWWFCRKLRAQTTKASALSYVTSVRLPERYPSKESSMKVFASSIELLNNHLSNRSRNYSEKSSFRLISVGALEDWRKGPDTALRALASLRRSGRDVTLTWVGDGRNRKEVERMAVELGISDAVTFKGHLPSGEAVFSALDEADIFILPTRGEGLPRAMIEAMARGLVCVGSDVGGIPELISDDFIHDPENDKRLAEIIERLITNKEEMNQASSKNLEKAHNYLAPEL